MYYTWTLLCTRAYQKFFYFIARLFPLQEIVQEIERLSNLIHKKEKILKQIIRIQQKQARVDESFCANDILDFMMSTNSNNDSRKVVHGSTSQLNIQNLIDECKTLFLTSYSIMASILTWTMLFLGEYLEWQEHA
jgi:PHYB activation tagged suppressor 1